MSKLIIGASQREQIAKLRELAALNPLDIGKAQAAAGRDIRAFRNWMRNSMLELPVGFMVVYTHEIQPYAPPPGLCHHISISVKRPREMPSLEAIEMILAEFGMQPIVESAKVWIEDVEPGHKAVNVAQMPGILAIAEGDTPR